MFTTLMHEDIRERTPWYGRRMGCGKKHRKKKKRDYVRDAPSFGEENKVATVQARENDYASLAR